MNRLAGETSPYLLQHADNPVDWYPWGEEALARARERIEERVTLGVDLVPARLLKDLAQEPPVVGHDLPVFVAELLQKPRRALDVGEQKGDGAAGKCHAVTVQA